MLKRVLLVLIFITGRMFAAQVTAQDSLLVDSLPDIDDIPVMDHAAFLADEANNITWRQALQKEFSHHHDLTAYIDSVYGNSRVTVWLKFSVQNAMTDTLPLTLLFHRYAYYKRVIAYNEADTVVYNPDYFVTSRRKEDRQHIISLLPPGDDITFLVKMYNPYANLYPDSFVVTYWESYRKDRMMMYHRSYPGYIFQIMFLAVVLFITLHTLVQYFVRRRREFIFYALYSFCVFLYFLYRLEHSIYYDLLFSYFPYIYKFCNNLLSILVYYTYFRFARRYVDFKSLWPWFHRVIIRTEQVLIAAFTADLFCSVVLNNYELRELLFLVLRVGLLLVSFVGIYLLLMSGRRVLYFFGVGSLLLIIGSLMAMVYSFYPDMNPYDFDAIRYMQFGIALELLCFTSGLSYKTHLIEIDKRKTQAQLIKQLEENQRLQEDLTTRLEARVKEQTEQILAQQKQLELEKEQQLTLEFTKKITEIELQLLKAQLNPHFYFNTLNNLYGLAMIAPKKAPDAILKLSDIMEYVIYDCRNDKVPLGKELKFIRSYIDLERLRYEDDASISLSVTGEANGKFISPMLLIQFVENAFKHGMEQQKNNSFLQVSIQVSNGRLYYESVNSMNGQSYKEGGVGLSNVKKRLDILYPGLHTLQVLPGDRTYKVKLEIVL